MININSSDLLLTYNNFLAIENILNYVGTEAERRIQSNTTFLNTIQFPFIGQILQKNKLTSLNLKFSEIKQFNKENAILTIVGEFERLVFDKVNSSSVLIKDVVHNGYSVGQPMHNFRVAFVKDESDIFNLAGFNKFLDSHPKYKDDLKEIIDFRNYLAHGKRLKVGLPSNMTLEQIVTTLDEILLLL